MSPANQPTDPVSGILPSTDVELALTAGMTELLCFEWSQPGTPSAVNSIALRDYEES